MKPRILVVAMLAVLGSGCSTTTDKQGLGYRVEPVQSIHHGGPTAQSYYQLGRYYQGQDRLGQAEDAYLKAVAADDKYIDAFNALASLYARRGETERAVKMFEKLTAIAPEAAYLYNNLGFAYYLVGRQEDAYANVRKALSLDSTLERGWMNLGLIAAKDGGPALVQAVRLHVLDTLPLALGSPQLPAAAPHLGTVAAAVPDAGFTVVTQPAPHPLVEEIRMADASNVIVMQEAVDHSGPEAATAGMADIRSNIGPEAAGPKPKSDGQFVVVSARQEMAAYGQPLEIAPAAAPATIDRTLTHPVRIEVSNGNGISRFASRFGALLRYNDIGVARVTNYATYAMASTVVEYQPGFHDDAQAVLSRVGMNATLVAATGLRAGVDVRIVLGRDAVRFCGTTCRAREISPRIVSVASGSAGT